MLFLLACAPDEDARLISAAPGSILADSGAETGGLDTAPADTGYGDSATDTATDTAPADTDSAGALMACWLGPARDGSVCLPVVAWDASWGSDYDYPDPYDGSAQYAQPARYVDLDAADPGLEIAPNFVLEEYMEAWKGRWGVMQAHVVELMQAVRDDVGGPLSVNSGYRSPAYNAGVGGVEYSRHQYGDAADLDVDGMSADDLADLCEAQGADYVATYTTGHTHCDWRDHALDPAFYDAAPAPPSPSPRPRHEARLVLDGEAWTAPATGFDEGEPARRWSAWSATGARLATGEGERFVVPGGTARVRVEIGRQVTTEAWISARSR